MNTTTPDITPFVSQDETRLGICFPFALGGWLYATDGRCCVRIPTDQPDSENDPEKRLTIPKSAPELFDGFNVDGLEPVEIPALVGANRRECEACAGDRQCDMGHMHTCDHCDGDCFIETWPTIEIGPARFSERFISKMVKLPGLKFYPRPEPEHSCFTFDGGQGLLMPIRTK